MTKTGNSAPRIDHFFSAVAARLDCWRDLNRAAQTWAANPTDRDAAGLQAACTAALTDLETFEIDGATKYLKLKIRKGKSYEFRAGAGDATALFTFQRDVEKARQKLLAGGGKEARW